MKNKPALTLIPGPATPILLVLGGLVIRKRNR